jgi:hypothetical protein
VKLRQCAESLGRFAVHPFLAKRFDDRLSILLIRSATSLTWNLISLGALLAAIWLFSSGTLQPNSAASNAQKVLITYAVVGVVWNAFAAMTHSASTGRYGRGLLLFSIWPLSFLYNWRETLRSRRHITGSDAA